jgi:hypothetical protein
MKKSQKNIIHEEITTPIVEFTDLRSITRSEQCITDVYLIHDYKQVPWLRFGAAQLRHNERTRSSSIAARLTAGVTDFEHDSAYAMRLPLIGVEFEKEFEYSIVLLHGWVDPSASEDFHVPLPGYDPSSLPGATVCKDARCSEPHPIVPEMHFAGPPSKDCRELYEKVRGKRVEIRIRYKIGDGDL